MKCVICKKNECSDDNNVCSECSTSGEEYKQVEKYIFKLNNPQQTKE